MAAKRDLEFFMANPGEIPADMSELEAAMDGRTGVDDGESEGIPGEQGEQGAASGAQVVEKAEKTGDANGKEAAQPEQVLKSKDGKHEIPYSVLQTEREQRRAAEVAVEQLRLQVEALTAQVSGKQVAQAAEQAAVPDLSEEDLQAIEEDFPTTGKALKALLARVGSLQAQLGAVEQAEGSRRAAESTRASTTVQEAIDANPHLSYWQQQDPEAFGAAVKFDNQIKSDPRNRGLSLDERFTKVVGAMAAVYGAVDLPPEYQRADTTRRPSGKPEQNVAAKAKQVIDQAQTRSRVSSLSDIPGGIGAESDEIDQLGMLSAQELGNKFMKMDLAKISDLLARAA